MVSQANNELKQDLTSSNPIYAKYTEDLWVEEVNSAAQLGSQSCTHMVKILFMLAISLLSQRQQF